MNRSPGLPTPLPPMSQRRSMTASVINQFIQSGALFLIISNRTVWMYSQSTPTYNYSAHNSQVSCPSTTLFYLTMYPLALFRAPLVLTNNSRLVNTVLYCRTKHKIVICISKISNYFRKCSLTFSHLYLY